MLKIKNLHAKVDNLKILKGIDLQVNAGEVHAIMGPNGSGKSTLSSVIAGKEEYEITRGEISFEGEDLGEMDAEERAHKGFGRNPNSWKSTGNSFPGPLTRVSPEGKKNGMRSFRWP